MPLIYCDNWRHINLITSFSIYWLLCTEYAPPQKWQPMARYKCATDAAVDGDEYYLFVRFLCIFVGFASISWRILIFTEHRFVLYTAEGDSVNRKYFNAEPEVETRPAQSTLAPMSIHTVIECLFADAGSPVGWHGHLAVVRCASLGHRWLAVSLTCRSRHRKSRDQRLRKRDFADVVSALARWRPTKWRQRRQCAKCPFTTASTGDITRLWTFGWRGHVVLRCTWVTRVRIIGEWW